MNSIWCHLLSHPILLCNGHGWNSWVQLSCCSRHVPWHSQCYSETHLFEVLSPGIIIFFERWLLFTLALLMYAFRHEWWYLDFFAMTYICPIMGRIFFVFFLSLFRSWLQKKQIAFKTPDNTLTFSCALCKNAMQHCWYGPWMRYLVQKVICSLRRC